MTRAFAFVPALLVLVLVLTGCGFHLRNAIVLPAEGGRPPRRNVSRKSSKSAYRGVAVAHSDARPGLTG